MNLGTFISKIIVYMNLEAFGLTRFLIKMLHYGTGWNSIDIRDCTFEQGNIDFCGLNKIPN